MIADIVQDAVRVLDIEGAKQGMMSNSTYVVAQDRVNDLKNKLSLFGGALISEERHNVEVYVRTNYMNTDMPITISTNGSSDSQLAEQIFKNIDVALLPPYDLKDDIFMNYTQQVLVGLNQTKKSNVLIIGETGTGKTHLAESLINYLITENVPGFATKNFLLLNAQDVGKDTQMSGQLEERLAVIEEMFNDSENFIFIDEIQSLLNKAHGDIATRKFVDAVRKVLSGKNKAKLLGTCLDSSYTKIVKDYEDLERRFSVVKIKEPTKQQMVKLINDNLKEHTQESQLTFDFDVLSFLQKYQSKFTARIFNPDATLTVIDKAISYAKTAKRKNVTQGDFTQASSDFTGFKPEFFNGNKKMLLNNVTDYIKNRFIGQTTALANVTHPLQELVLNINNESKPVCVELLLGSGGLGKTYLVTLLAQGLFGLENQKAKLIVINGGELANEHDSTKVLGSPPSYVGFGEENLCDKFKREPNSIFLFDEIEKAHDKILRLFFKAFSEGYMTDASGNNVSLKNTLIFLTSNIGVDSLLKSETIKLNQPGAISNVENRLTKEKLLGKLKDRLDQSFIDRITGITVFENFTDEDIKNMINLNLKNLILEIEEKTSTPVKYPKNLSDQMYESLMDKVTLRDPFSVRSLERLMKKLRQSLVDQLLENKATLKLKL